MMIDRGADARVRSAPEGRAFQEAGPELAVSHRAGANKRTSKGWAVGE
jgi:hypothetical protein